MHLKALLPSLALFAAICSGVDCAARLSDERIIFQTSFGDIEMALYPEVSLSFFPERDLLRTLDRLFWSLKQSHQSIFFAACF